MKKVGGIDMFGTRGYKVAVLGAAGGIGQVRIPSGPHTRAPVSCARAGESERMQKLPSLLRLPAPRGDPSFLPSPPSAH
jgi:hypothetical protein